MQKHGLRVILRAQSHPVKHFSVILGAGLPLYLVFFMVRCAYYRRGVWLTGCNLPGYHFVPYLGQYVHSIRYVVHFLIVPVYQYYGFIL
ncbi:hypothetical protein CENSYa_0703 [Cenarchaeum symbiosum A]|uniref:Uncharacterized protein n=1 Tax=Cenarchaeum symbiosum (strain A) TaxID=414004 RepID=A0RVG9_CENSY|nr:hypothetical protein CENSYa_0703 [Cenarchaeum symbiosum A]